MKIKVSEATPTQLDWMVAKCEGLIDKYNEHLAGNLMEGMQFSGYYMDPNIWIPLNKLRYTTDWAQGGPIIEREEIATRNWPGCGWYADYPEKSFHISTPGSTLLIAAMRCYVVSKLGDEISLDTCKELK